MFGQIWAVGNYDLLCELLAPRGARPALAVLFPFSSR